VLATSKQHLPVQVIKSKNNSNIYSFSPTFCKFPIATFGFMNRLITLLIVAGICNCLGSKVSSPVVDKFFEDAQETQTLLAGSQKINGTLPIGIRSILVNLFDFTN
jgi:hypothetical protein